SLASICWFFAYLYSAKGEPGRAIELLKRGATLTRKWNLHYFSARYSVSLCHAYALAGRTAECLPLLDRTLNAFRKTEHSTDALGLMLLTGDACLQTGRLSDAREVATRALKVFRDGGQRAHEARALCLLGNAEADAKSAARHYHEALAL